MVFSMNKDNDRLQVTLFIGMLSVHFKIPTFQS